LPWLILPAREIRQKEKTMANKKLLPIPGGVLPISGSEILEMFHNDFLEKHTDENGQIKAIVLWPYPAIEEAFQKVNKEICGENEAKALKTFHKEMVHFLRMGTVESFEPEEAEFILSLLEGGV
jgi:hypothetical protein